MNLNQLINMVIKIVTRRAVNFGIDKGAQMMARRGGETASPEQQKQARAMAKRARHAAKITRRMR